MVTLTVIHTVVGAILFAFFGAGRAHVLQVDSARKGSCRRGAPAGNHGMSTARTTELTLSARASGYVALTKPDVSFLVLMRRLPAITWARAARRMAAPDPRGFRHDAHRRGHAALNHYIERESDRYMRRTALRPLPSGVLQPREALVLASR